LPLGKLNSLTCGKVADELHLVAGHQDCHAIESEPLAAVRRPATMHDSKGNAANTLMPTM
jgi:hypothetical protein